MGVAEQRADLSVVIVSYNTRDLTRQCLQSIFENTRGVSFEVWVVDNNSSDDTVEMVQREFPQVNVIRNEINKGLAAATNQGLAASTARYVLALNSDVVVLPDAFVKLVRFMDAHPEVGGATPRLLLPDGSPHPAFYGRVPTFKVELLEALAPVCTSIAKAVPRARFGRGLDYENTQEVPCILWGTCFIVRRKVLETVGLQDPRFFVYGEDVDWSMRMTKAGWKLYYVADAEVIHHGGQSTKQASAKMFAQLFKSKCRLVQKHYGLLAGLALRLAVASVCGMRMAKWIGVYMIRQRMRSEAAARIHQMWKIVSAVLAY